MNGAGPGPIVGAGHVLTQLQGWTQPNRVGWVDVPAQHKQKGWQHSNQQRWLKVAVASTGRSGGINWEERW